MKTVKCDLTNADIVNGVPNYGRGVHNIVVNAAKDISVNLSFKGANNGVAAAGPDGMWSGQTTGGTNLSKAGFVAALVIAQTAANIVHPAVPPSAGSAHAALGTVCDLTDEAIAPGSRNFGRGTATVNIDAAKGIIMEATFFQGNSGGVDLSEAGFVAAMLAAHDKVAATPVGAQSGNHIATGGPGPLTTEAPGVTRPS